MEIKKLNQEISESRDNENTKAAAVNLQGMVDYIAMMTGVELPTNEEVYNDER